MLRRDKAIPTAANFQFFLQSLERKYMLAPRRGIDDANIMKKAKPEISEYENMFAIIKSRKPSEFTLNKVLNTRLAIENLFSIWLESVKFICSISTTL